MPDPRIDFSSLVKFGRQIKGVEDALTLKERNKIVRESSVRLGRLVRRETPRKTGNLRKSIGRKKYTRWPIYLVGPRWPKGAHGNILEEGTGPRQTRSGANRGSAPPTRWFSKLLSSAGPAEARRMGAEASVQAAEKFTEIARRINRSFR